MAEPKKKQQKESVAKALSSTHAKMMSARRSTDIVIALAGPLGCGLKEVTELLDNQFSGVLYQVHKIKVSTAIENHFAALKKPLPAATGDEGERIEKLQNAGNQLREKYHYGYLAALAINEIAHIRHDDLKDDEMPAPTFDSEEPKRVFIIDQLKHPSEVSLLRSLYQDLFYLVGVLSNKQIRLERLVSSRHLQPELAQRLIQIDKRQDQKFGQRLEDTLHLSDYFIRNNHVTAGGLNTAIQRFISVVFGTMENSPTEDEYGMYTAHASAKRSACLSRQVGASIMTESGEIIATGRNDVPKAHGGLYGDIFIKDQGKDHRCFKQAAGICHNDKNKHALKDTIEEITLGGLEGVKDAKKIASAISDKIYNQTRIKSLIEFSRSIHAEMDAILSVARIPGTTTVGATMYSTTYPCHNCARHIVAAGIKRVVYIEPYEKSLATELHGDSIRVPGSATPTYENPRIEFVEFDGVSPTLYDKVFSMHQPRKDESGKKLDYGLKEPISYEYVDSYLDIETIISKDVLQDLQEGV